MNLLNKVVRVIYEVLHVPLFIIFLMIPYAFVHLIAWLTEMNGDIVQPKY